MLDSHDLVLYYRPTCPFCVRVLKRMKDLGIEGAITLKNISDDEEAEATLISVGGKRQVPCLFIDGEPLYESGDIVTWLERHSARA